ncbi:MAG: hypothetical protein IJW66_01155 [Clostridia bacterium]|nr:hypothetical protein [Clostridia bacterium]
MKFDLNDKNTYPRRQVHLDFHTSPDIEGIGVRFSKEQFQAALKRGKVNSVTLFAKCHNGYCYYPTKIGTMHPHLDFDLLGAELDACHEIGVRAPIYITGGWSHLDSITHPEWNRRDADGSVSTVGDYDLTATPDTPKPMCCWVHLCLNDNGYCRHIYELTEEVCKRYERVDGLFYDIIFIGSACYCDECVKGMKEMGLDPSSETDAHAYYVKKHIDFMKKCDAILKKYHPDATIFFNSGGANMNMPEYPPYESHYEMEDLPTAWGGYNKMPPRARFFKKYGKFYLGMTGKFHYTWGEFGGYKSKEALKYEICTMAQYGAGCSIGDHLYPDGEMDAVTYENIGYAYGYHEKIEEYCYGGDLVTNLGVYMDKNDPSLQGVVDILLENQLDFDFVSGGNFDKFDTVIVPSGVTLREEDREALLAFTKGGGKLLLIGSALIKDGKHQIATGINGVSESKNDTDFIKANIDGANLPASPFLAYTPAPKVTVGGAEIISQLYPPLFNRTYGRFCGHRNTPYDKDGAPLPAMTKYGNTVFMAHDVGALYAEWGMLCYKDYMIAALTKVLGYSPILKTSFGSAGRVTMLRQGEKSRYSINLTYATPMTRGAAQIIDEMLPVHDIKIEVNIPEKVKSVKLPLQDKTLEFSSSDGKVSFTLPRLHCHETIIIEY